MVGDPDAIGVLEDGTVYYAPIGELVHDGEEGVLCHLCGRSMRMIGGTHLRWHGWTLEAYRETFQLRQGVATCSRELSENMRRNATERIGRDGFGTPPAPEERAGAVARTPRWRSLAVVRPELVAELDNLRNGAIDSHALAAGSRVTLWWRCAVCGHRWRASLTNRLARGSGCPACGLRNRAAKRRRVSRERSLGARHPALAAELHPTRNGQLDPYALGARSAQVVWWRCAACGHEWRATVANRSSGTGCPACWEARRGATFGAVPTERSLQATMPTLAAELHPSRNPRLDPTKLGAHSSRRVWWRCAACRHEWQARVADRTAGTGCPRCARRLQRDAGPRPVSVERSLAARRPELAAELHPTRNPGIDPATLSAGSGATLWWRCPRCGHEWQSRVYNRSRGSVCPTCARRPAPG